MTPPPIDTAVVPRYDLEALIAAARREAPGADALAVYRAVARLRGLELRAARGMPPTARRPSAQSATGEIPCGR